MFFGDKKVRWKFDGKSVQIVIPRVKRMESVVNRVLQKTALEQTKRLFEIIGNPVTILDIGANCGYQAVHYYYAVSPERIFCFEPSKYNYGYLKKNVKECLGVSCFNLGLSDRAESATISMPSFSQNARVQKMLGNTGLLSLYGESQSGRKEKVTLTTLDDWMNEIKLNVANCFIKIDAEGHEYAILKGAEKALSSNNVFQIEFNPATLRMAKVDPLEVFCFMNTYSFSSYIFEDDFLKPFSPEMLCHNERVVDVVFLKK